MLEVLRMLTSHFGDEILIAFAELGDEGLIEDGEGAEAVDAEAAKVLAKLAPGDGGPGIAPEVESNGTEAALGCGAAGVGVVDGDDAGIFDGLTQLFEFVAGESSGFSVESGARCVEGDGVDAVAQGGGEDGFDLAQGVVGGGGQLGVSPGGNHAAAEDEGGDFAGIEHEWRQVVVAAKGVADTGFAEDRDAGELEVLDVAVDGALGDLELGGQAAGGLQAAGAQELDDAEEAVGSAHDGMLIEQGLWDYRDGDVYGGPP